MRGFCPQSIYFTVGTRGVLSPVFPCGQPHGVRKGARELHGPVAVHSCSHSWQISRSCPPTEANNEQGGREPSDRGGGPDHWAAGDGRTSARAHTKRSPHSFPTDPPGQIHTERAQQGIFQPSPWQFDGSLGLHPPQGCLSNSRFPCCHPLFICLIRPLS